MVTVTLPPKAKTTATGPGIVPRDDAMTVTQACNVRMGELDADCIMESVTTQTRVYVQTCRPGLSAVHCVPLGRVVRHDGDADNQPTEGFRKIVRDAAGRGNDDGHDSGHESMFESASEPGEHSAEDGSAASPDCMWDVWC